MPLTFSLWKSNLRSKKIHIYSSDDPVVRRSRVPASSVKTNINLMVLFFLITRINLINLIVESKAEL